jgi:hypothetical protein
MSEHHSKQGSSRRRAKPSKERLHGNLRVALWYVYERRCVYTGEHISGPEHVVIDHVLPERLADNDNERQRAIAAFGLPSDFQIRGNLGNLVPTTQAFNALKLDKIQPDEIVPRYAQPYVRHRPYEDRQNAHAWPVQALIAYGLVLAQQNRAAVEHMQRRIDWEEKLLALKSQMPPELRTQDPPYELLSDEEPEFPVRNECDETRGSYPHGLFSRPGVYLDSFLPRLSDMTGTALIMFKSFKVRDARIMFDHQGILTQLLPGANIGRAAGERPFLVRELCRNRGWCIQLANVRVELTRQHMEELCEVIDCLAECYLTVAEDLERYVLQSIRFPYAQRGYRLYQMPSGLWSTVLAFAEVHEYGMGDSEWHVFSTNGNGFAIFPRDGGQPVALFHAEPDHRGVSNWGVSLCWDPRPLIRFNSWKYTWNAEAAHDWFARLLQHTVAWSQGWREPGTGYPLTVRLVRWLGLKGGKRSGSASQLERLNMGVSQRQTDFQRTAGMAFRSYEALRTAIYAMQSHYSMANPTHCVRGNSAAGVYEFLSWCARTLDLSGTRAAHTHRALGQNDDMSFTDAVDHATIEVRGRAAVGTATVDYALRAVIAMLREPIIERHEDALVDAAVTHLASLYEDYRFQAYLDRLASRPW